MSASSVSKGAWVPAVLKEASWSCGGRDLGTMVAPPPKHTPQTLGCPWGALQSQARGPRLAVEYADVLEALLGRCMDQAVSAAAAAAAGARETDLGVAGVHPGAWGRGVIRG